MPDYKTKMVRRLCCRLWNLMRAQAKITSKGISWLWISSLIGSRLLRQELKAEESTKREELPPAQVNLILSTSEDPAVLAPKLWPIAWTKANKWNRWFSSQKTNRWLFHRKETHRILISNISPIGLEDQVRALYTTSWSMENYNSYKIMAKIWF